MAVFSIIALAFAKEVGKKSGAAAFDSVFGNSQELDTEALMREFRTALEEFAVRIRKDINDALFRERQRDAEVAVEQILRAFGNYSARGEDAEKDIVGLGLLTKQSNNCTVLVADIGVAAILNYVLVASIELAIWNERVLILGTSEREAIEERILPNVIYQTNKMINELRQMLEKRFSSIQTKFYFNNKTGEPYSAVDYYTFDGKMYKSGPKDITNRRDSELHAKRNKHIAKEWKKLAKEFDAAFKAIEIWTKLYISD